MLTSPVLTADIAAHFLDPVGDIGRIADDGVIDTPRTADVSNHHLTDMQADAESDFRTVDFPLGGVIALHPALDRQRRPTGPVGCVEEHLRRAPNCHHPVADKLIDGAAFRIDTFGDHGEVIIEKFRRRRGRHRF